MPRNFEVLQKYFRNLPAGFARDPRVVVRGILGALLLANIVAAFAVFRPIGGSAEELDSQLAALRQQVQSRQASLKRLRFIVSKMDQASTTSNQFLSVNFMSRKTASSSILSELAKSAKDSGMKPKGDACTFEPVEGSDAISMMTIAANYEGTYGDLLQFVNRLDKSPRFLI